MILWDRWQKLVEERGGAPGLFDLQSGRGWSIGELDAQARNHSGTEQDLIRPDGFSANIVFDTLRAWRDGVMLCPSENPEKKPVAPFPADAVHGKSTSGSTGEPTWIFFTGEQLLADVDRIVSTMRLRPEHPNLAVISAAHSYGFSNLVLPLLIHGIPLVWLGNAFPAAVAEALRHSWFSNGSVIAAVPAIWKAWFRAGMIDSKKIHIAISAGAPLSLGLERGIHAETGLKVHNFYGSTECGGIAYDRSDEPRRFEGEIGTAMNDTELGVTDEGLLTVTSDAVGLGCHSASSGRSARMSDRTFTTSDRAVLWEDKRYPGQQAVRLLGRSDDVLNVAGRKIAPETIETVVELVDGVEHCVVFGVPSPDRERVTEIVAVVRCCKEGVSESDLRQVASKHLPPIEIPKTWWLCDELAPDRRGKYSRHHWRKRFLELHRAKK